MMNYISFISAIILTVLLFLACAKNDESVAKKEFSDGWSESDKHTFLKDCRDGDYGSIPKEKIELYCDCMLEKLMNKYKKYAYTSGRERIEFKSMIDSCDKAAGIDGFD
jgi:hypothetical protein